MTDRETMEYDVVVVGAGPAGLAAAIRLRQLSPDIRVCVVEKGSEVGAHILSGAAIETRALDELIPDWKAKGAPLHTSATRDLLYFLTEKRAFNLPVPPAQRNHGNYIVSLGNLCRWLGKQAEALGAEIFPGFAAAEEIIEDGRVCGVITGDLGRDKSGQPKTNFQPGVALRAKYTLLAEGCRGSLSERIMARFGLREGVAPQTYGIGIKELWEVDAARHRPGTVMHSVGWPLDRRTYGGSFLYHLENRQVAVGFVVGLDYANPALDPFMEFQRFKTHPAIRPHFEGGRRISYGARALNEGGWQAIPRLTFPGGALIGDAAGFLNVAKIKGTHNAMKSGMAAAEAVHEAMRHAAPPLLDGYPKRLAASWIVPELHEVRNIRPAFGYGLLAGLLYSGLELYLLRGRAPWTLQHRKPDHLATRRVSECPRIVYPKPDGVLTFDRMSSVYLSNTNHEEDQPCHLKLRDATVPVKINLPHYAGPEQRYCPAGVYEFVQEASGARLQINAANCVHCKTCDIKDPRLNIHWTVPEGSGGPNYTNM